MHDLLAGITFKKENFMKKPTIIIIILAIVALAVVGYNLSSKGAGDDLQMKDMVRTSIENLMAENNPVKCIATVTMDDGGKMTGTVYVADGKMRNDAAIENVQGEKFQSHTIMDEEWLYSWSTGLPDGGIKMKVSDIENMPDEEEEDPSGGVKNLDRNFDFNCNKWTVDESKFVPPSDVNFQDFAQKMQDTQDMTQGIEMEGSQGMTLEQVCQMCSMLPEEEAKQQCLTDAGCE